MAELTVSPYDREVTVRVPLKRTTSNYALFEVPFDRDVTRTNLKAYLTQSEWNEIGAPLVVEVTFRSASAKPAGSYT